jgi:putative transposase
MWTEAQREGCVRRSVRYPSDLTDAEWREIAPLIPPARMGGRPRTTDMREALNGLLYLLRTGCQWRYLPKDFPPRSTIYNIFRQWQRDGDWDRIHHALLVKSARGDGPGGEPECRHHRQPIGQIGRKRGVSIDPVGYDAGKKVKGRKRHLVVDTQGLVLNAVVHPANIQDRDDGALLVLAGLRHLFPWLALIWADGAYKGRGLDALFANKRRWRLEVVKRTDNTGGFKVLPRRWVVERTLGWIGRSRRLARDYEGLAEIACAYIKMAMIQLMIRRLATD